MLHLLDMSHFVFLTLELFQPTFMKLSMCIKVAETYFRKKIQCDQF